MHFRDWMEQALYHSQGGYYSTHLKSVPDYVTAPNFGPYLGQAVAKELIRCWGLLPRLARPKVFTIVEAGCGSEAALARGVLETAAGQAPEILDQLQIILVDRSVARLGHAVESLQRVYPGKVYGCPDLSQIPPIWGAVISNELFDALPVHLIRRRLLDVEEGYVEARAGSEPVFSWKKSQDPILTSFGLDIPSGVTYALNLEGLKFLEIAAGRLTHGFVISIDFGDTQPTVFDRSPVKAFSRGALKLPDWNKPGHEDLTSPVDFTLLMDWGRRLGLESLSYETLGNFLVRQGIGDQIRAGSGRQDVEGNLKIKTLIHPHGFGQDFKVLIQGK